MRYPEAMERSAGIAVTTATDPRWTKHARVTYRQLDYWTTKGYLLTTDGAASPGIGQPRVWPVTEIEVAARMIRLIAAGLVPRAAALVARNGFGVTNLGDGITIEVRGKSQGTR